MGGGGSGGVGAVDIRGWWGGVVQNRESPDFRSAEVGRYAVPSTKSSVSVVCIMLYATFKLKKKQSKSTLVYNREYSSL